MPTRETWNWKAVVPGKGIQFRLLFDRGTRDDGASQKDGEVRVWHRYPVAVGSDEFTMFSPNDKVHDALQFLGVNTKGNTFTVTQMLDKNPETGKTFTYYLVDFEGQTMDTRQQIGPPKEKGEDSPFDEANESLRQDKMVEIWERAYAWVTQGVEEPNMDNKWVQLRLAVVEKTSTIVNTQAMQNGGGKR